MRTIVVNSYLSFTVEPTSKGDIVTCLLDGISIGYKSPCRHQQCLVKFIAEATIKADEMHRFEQVFEQEKNQN